MSDTNFFNALIVVIVGSLIALVYFAWVDKKETAAQKGVFMESCLKDHKQYECDALWGQSRPPVVSSTTTVIPVPVYTR